MIGSADADQRSASNALAFWQRIFAVFGGIYAAEPDVLIEQLRKHEAIAEAHTLLLTIPNQLGVPKLIPAMQAGRGQP